MSFSHLTSKLSNTTIVSGYDKTLWSCVLGAVFHSVLQSLCSISLTLVLLFFQLEAEQNLNPCIQVLHEKGLNEVLHGICFAHLLLILVCAFTETRQLPL